MAVVTISRQIGSRGGEIASGLASALRYHLVGREAFEALFEQYGLVEFNQVYDAPAGLLGKLTSRRAEVTDMLTKIVRAVARHGDAVIVGRGGFAALRGLDDVLNVRVQAPRPIRVQRLEAERRIPDGENPEAFVRAQDERRAAFVDSSYSVRWDSADEFDLVLDTAKLSTELATSLLAHAARALVGARGPAGRLAAELQVDPVLANAVSDVLKCQGSHGLATSVVEQPTVPSLH